MTCAGAREQDAEQVVAGRVAMTDKVMPSTS